MRLKFKARVNTIDDAGFKEDDHPRAPDGKFTSGAAGGKAIQSGVTFPKAGSLSNKIWHMAHDLSKKNGKAPTAKELNAYAASHGLEINPATASTQLNNYKKWVSNKTAEGKAEAPKAKEEKLPNTAAGMATLAQLTSFKKEYSNESITYYQKGVNKISYVEASGTWQFKKDGELFAKGDNLEDLKAAISKYAFGNTTHPDQPKPTEAQKPTKPIPPPDNHSVKSAPSYAGTIPSTSFAYTKQGVPNTKGFPEAIKNSIQRYTGSAYKAINAAMRFEADYDNLSPQVMRDILHLQKAFHVVPATTEECTVGRKVGLDALKILFSIGKDAYREILSDQ